MSRPDPATWFILTTYIDIPLNPGWLIGILIVAYYNPYITGKYNPLYQTSNFSDFSECLRSDGRADSFEALDVLTLVVNHPKHLPAPSEWKNMCSIAPVGFQPIYAFRQSHLPAMFSYES